MSLLLIDWVIQFYLEVIIPLWIRLPPPFLVTEQQISEKLKMLKKENADLVQKLSNYEQKV